MDPERLPPNLRGARLSSIVDILRLLFQQILQRATEGLNPTDMVRICILADGLDKPISTHLMQVSAMTVEKVLAVVLKILQSKDTIILDEGFSVNVLAIHRDVGAGKRFRKVINVETDRLRKQAILAIPSDNEGLCCAKAIVFALAHLENNSREIETLRKRNRPALMNRARQLHADSGVPLGPCTYSEIRQFEDYLNVQIVVFSTENLNKVTN